MRSNLLAQCATVALVVITFAAAVPRHQLGKEHYIILAFLLWISFMLPGAVIVTQIMSASCVQSDFLLTYTAIIMLSLGTAHHSC